VKYDGKCKVTISFYTESGRESDFQLHIKCVIGKIK